MNEKAPLPTDHPNAPMQDAQQFYQPPPPPYSPNPPDYKTSDPTGVPQAYPTLGFQPMSGEAQPMVQPVVGQPMIQPMIQPVIQQVIQTAPALAVLGPDSVRMACPHCRADMNTSVHKDPSIAAFVSAGILFLFGCVCGCCLIPFCMDSCKTAEHHCANCRKFVGRYSRY